MKQPYIILVIVGVIAAASLTAYAAMRHKQPTFRVYGEDALTTTASDDVVAAARREVHRLFVDWKTDAEGNRSDPSFLESGRSWTTGPEGARDHALGRGTTEFNDAKGHHIVIEIIDGTNMPTLVFFSPKSGDGTASVLNAFIASLQKQGVRLAGS